MAELQLPEQLNRTQNSSAFHGSMMGGTLSAFKPLDHTDVQGIGKFTPTPKAELPVPAPIPMPRTRFRTETQGQAPIPIPRQRPEHL